MWSAEVDRVTCVHPVNLAWGKGPGALPAPEEMLMWRMGHNHGRGVGGALWQWLSFWRPKVGF